MAMMTTMTMMATMTKLQVYCTSNATCLYMCDNAIWFSNHNKLKSLQLTLFIMTILATQLGSLTRMPETDYSTQYKQTITIQLQTV